MIHHLTHGLTAGRISGTIYNLLTFNKNPLWSSFNTKTNLLACKFLWRRQVELLANNTWHNWLQHHLCYRELTSSCHSWHTAGSMYHPQTWCISHGSAPKGEPESSWWHLRWHPGHYGVVWKVFYAKVALCFPRELASRNALQEQKQIKMSLDKPEATAQALTARARLCWRSRSPGLSHWLQTICCSVFLLSLSTAPAALVFNPEVSLGMHGAMVWDNILSTFQVPKDFITSSPALFPGLAVQLATIVHKESICVNLKTSGGYVSIGKDEILT